MRLTLLGAALSISLAACGGPETSQANNVQANISNEARPGQEAVSSATKSSPAPPLNSNEAAPRAAAKATSKSFEGVGRGRGEKPTSKR